MNKSQSFDLERKLSESSSKKFIGIGSKTLLLLFLFLSVGSGCFLGYKQLHRPSKKAEKQNPFVLDEKSFVVVVPSYNNSAYVDKNLRSIFHQNYHNYRVIYIDDHSLDDTGQKAVQITQQLNQQNRTLIIHNDENKGALANLYRAIHLCQNHEIVVVVDGDDFLAHENVLSKLNQIYADPNVWLTYGNFLDYPSFSQKPVCCKKLNEKTIRNNSFRKEEWVTTHLRSFYAGLFKQIKLKDFIYRGKFYPMASDLAFMYPLLEMSGKHTLFIEEILYLYNRGNPLNDHKVNFAFQKQCADTIRNTRAYAPLKNLPLKNSSYKDVVDLLVFSSNPVQLYAFLESSSFYLGSINKIFILHEHRLPSLISAYEEVKKAFPEHTYIALNEKDLKIFITKILSDPALQESSHLLIATDDLLIKDFLDLKEPLQALKTTDVEGFYFSQSPELVYNEMQQYREPPPFFSLNWLSQADSIFGWQLTKENDPLELVLCNKDKFQKKIASLDFQNLNELRNQLLEKKVGKSIGLCFSHVKTCKYPLGFDALEKFKAGLKIDITPYRQVQNSSKTIHREVVFIPR